MNALACSLLQVPWSSLGRVPVEVKIDRLYLLATPKTDEQRAKLAHCSSTR